MEWLRGGADNLQSHQPISRLSDMVSTFPKGPGYHVPQRGFIVDYKDAPVNGTWRG
jgi:hypothetical protein